mmetsp:Transcript_105942/g.341753  ORF Transcript_105942/g.341753 Transcript_105942/m.341753 type:complete len:354 (+) Transcript_105942:66-1127(+)
MAPGSCGLWSTALSAAAAILLLLRLPTAWRPPAAEAGEQLLATTRAPAPVWCEQRGCSLRGSEDNGQEAFHRMKIILSSDLFDISDGGPLPLVLQNMVEETGWRGRNATAVWLRDARSGWSDAYERFVSVDKPGMERMAQLGITNHVGLWINRDGRPGAHMILEDDIVGNVSRTADVDLVKDVISNATVLVVPGGEPFRLLQSLRSPLGSEVWAHALRRLRRGELVYVARSAGTIAAGSNVDITGFRGGATLRESQLYLGNPIDWSGLSLLPGSIALRPHYVPGGKLGAEQRTADNRGKWSDDDFVEHLQAEHPGVTPVTIRDGDFVALDHGVIKFGRDFAYLLKHHEQAWMI